MLRSVAVDGRSPAAAFLKALQSDLVRFGRQDTLLFDSGDATAFIWDPDFATSASLDLRYQALTAAWLADGQPSSQKRINYRSIISNRSMSTSIE